MHIARACRIEAEKEMVTGLYDTWTNPAVAVRKYIQNIDRKQSPPLT